MSEGERRLAAIMFTDMVGYTTLGQRNEALSLDLVTAQRKLIRPILIRHNGREVKTMGDAFLVEFPNALDATRCAYDIQRAIREFDISLPEHKRIRLRVGLHLGDVVASGGDISGDAVNIASRIESLAEDGGVCLTRQVYESTHSKFEMPLVSIGLKALKNVSEPMEVYKMVLPWENAPVATLTQFAKTRIAVLPFANMSPDPSDEYFADGMTEELISTMSKISGLRVIARTSVMGYKGGSKTIGDVAKELEVGTILEGSVRKAGDRVRITTQLIDSQTSEHLWADSFDRDMKDVFAVQSEISKTVAESLKVQLLLNERARIEKRQEVNPEAYMLYLKGRFYFDERTKVGGEKAQRYFEQAIKADQKFAPAYSGLADTYGMMADYGWLVPNEAYPLSKDLVMKALELDSELAEGHASLGWTLQAYYWDFTMAEREFKRAIELRPNYAVVHHWYSLMMFYLGKYEEEYALDKKAVELDPYAKSFNMGLASSLAFLGRMAESMQLFRRTIELNPDWAWVHLWKGLVHAWIAEYEAAIDETKTAFEMDGSPAVEAFHGWACAAAGHKSKAQEILDHIVERAVSEYVSPVSIAIAKLSVGNSDEGFKWLEKGVADRDSSILEFRGMPWFKEYRSDPRWKEIDDKLGLSTT